MDQKVTPSIDSPFLKGMSEQEKQALIERLIKLLMELFKRMFAFILRLFGFGSKKAEDAADPEKAIASAAQRSFNLAFSPMAAANPDDLAEQARAKLPYLGSLYLSSKKTLEDRESKLSAHLEAFNKEMGGTAWSLQNVHELLNDPVNALHAKEFARVAGGEEVANSLLNEVEQARLGMAESSAAFRLLAGHVRERGILAPEECDEFEAGFPDRVKDSGLSDQAVAAAVAADADDHLDVSVFLPPEARENVVSLADHRAQPKDSDGKGA